MKFTQLFLLGLSMPFWANATPHFMITKIDNQTDKVLYFLRFNEYDQEGLFNNLVVSPGELKSKSFKTPIIDLEGKNFPELAERNNDISFYVAKPLGIAQSFEKMPEYTNVELILAAIQEETLKNSYQLDIKIVANGKTRNHNIVAELQTEFDSLTNDDIFTIELTVFEESIPSEESRGAEESKKVKKLNKQLKASMKVYRYIKGHKKELS